MYFTDDLLTKEKGADVKQLNQRQVKRSKA